MVIQDVYLLQRSEQFKLGSRQEVTVDISLEKAPESPCTVLRGVVSGICGRIKGATVKVLDGNNKPVAHTVTDYKGNFKFDNILPQGDYKVIATAEDYKISRVYRLKLEPNKPVYIYIWLEESDFVNLATVYGVVYNELNIGLENVRIMITDYDRPDIYAALTQTNEDGEFLVYGLKPKKYWISVLKEGYYLPHKVSFELRANEIACVNLFLYPDESSKDGTVSGIIDSCKLSVPNAVAALYKIEESGHYLLAIKEANENGFYLFPNMKPGEYLVKSKKETDSITYITE